MVKHSEFIQTIVARHASSSFLLKGWSVTLVAALFALAAKDADARFVWVALGPVLGFCALDAYYLHQEKRFRHLFDWVRQGMTGLSDVERQELGPFCLDPNRVPGHETRLLVNAWSALFCFRCCRSMGCWQEPSCSAWWRFVANRLVAKGRDGICP